MEKIAVFQVTPGRRVLQEVQTLEEHHNWSIDSNVALRSRQAEPQSLFIAYPANFLFLNVSSAGPACLSDTWEVETRRTLK